MPYRRTRPLNVTPENPQIAWGDSINKGLVAYYPCNEPGGLKVRCAVNPAQNLTLSSGYTSRLSGPGGALGRGLKFTNATQYAQGALVKAVTGGPCTVACWITIDAMPSLSAILVALGSSAVTDVEYITYIYANNLNWGHSADDLQPSTAPVSAGQRVFVVGSTGSSKQQSIYRNGWLAGTRTATAFPTVSTTVTLGGQYNANTGNNFVGSIDNVRIYNRALSQSEVTRLYQEPLAGVVSPRRRTVGAKVYPSVYRDMTVAVESLPMATRDYLAPSSALMGSQASIPMAVAWTAQAARDYLAPSSALMGSQASIPMAVAWTQVRATGLAAVADWRTPQMAFCAVPVEMALSSRIDLRAPLEWNVAASIHLDGGASMEWSSSPKRDWLSLSAWTAALLADRRMSLESSRSLATDRPSSTESMLSTALDQRDPVAWLAVTAPTSRMPTDWGALTRRDFAASANWSAPAFVDRPTPAAWFTSLIGPHGVTPSAWNASAGTSGAGKSPIELMRVSGRDLPALTHWSGVARADQIGRADWLTYLIGSLGLAPMEISRSAQRDTLLSPALLSVALLNVPLDFNWLRPLVVLVPLRRVVLLPGLRPIAVLPYTRRSAFVLPYRHGNQTLVLAPYNI